MAADKFVHLILRMYISMYIYIDVKQLKHTVFIQSIHYDTMLYCVLSFITLAAILFTLGNY